LNTRVKILPSAALVFCLLVVAGCGTRTITRTVTVSAPVSTGASGETFEQIPEVVRQVSPSIVTIFVQTAQGEAEGSRVIWTRPGRLSRTTTWSMGPPVSTWCSRADRECPRRSRPPIRSTTLPS
jgi:hypothetical protein